jgi:hypothetical protein
MRVRTPEMAASGSAEDPRHGQDDNKNPSQYPADSPAAGLPDYIIKQSIEDPEKTKEVEDGKIGKGKDQ